ncbi:MAG TPA: hypothetical protein VGI05_11350 [Streptosporangiaceae bacterium]|jgi:peptidoglycan/xylan/chitin deacetylase (PgdA/CDA1 family)
MAAVDSGIDPGDWDWPRVSDAQVIARVLAQLHPGAIVQLHDGTNAIGRDHGHPGYLPGLLRALKQRGHVMLALPGNEPGGAD